MIFFVFQYGFKSSSSAVDLCTLMLSLIELLGALRYSTELERVWHAVFLHKHKYYKIPDQVCIVRGVNFKYLPPEGGNLKN